jgi:hypothetical protein
MSCYSIAKIQHIPTGSKEQTTTPATQIHTGANESHMIARTLSFPHDEKIFGVEDSLLATPCTGRKRTHLMTDPL